MSLGCLFCPRRIAITGDKKGVRIALTRGVCPACSGYIRQAQLDENQLMKEGVLLAPKDKRPLNLWASRRIR